MFQASLLAMALGAQAPSFDSISPTSATAPMSPAPVFEAAGVDGDDDHEHDSQSRSVGALAPMAGVASLSGTTRVLFGIRGEWFVVPEIAVGTQGMTTSLSSITSGDDTAQGVQHGDQPDLQTELGWGGFFVSGHLRPRKRVGASLEGGLNWGLLTQADGQSTVFLPHVAGRVNLAVTSWMDLAAGPSVKAMRGGYPGARSWEAVPGVDLVVRFRVMCRSGGDDHSRLGTLHSCV